LNLRQLHQSFKQQNIVDVNKYAFTARVYLQTDSFTQIVTKQEKEGTSRAFVYNFIIWQLTPLRESDWCTV